MSCDDDHLAQFTDVELALEALGAQAELAARVHAG